MSFVIKSLPEPSLPVLKSRKRFPVRRIFCVGRNYRDHTVEMGGNPDRDPPIFFMKPADALIEHGHVLPYPPKTQDLHHEVELVLAVGKGGRNISVDTAKKHIYGFGIGIDFTRRDLQQEAKAAGQPWDMAKSFDGSAAMGEIVPVKAADIGAGTGIGLKVNGEFRQRAKLGEMIWSIGEIVSRLSEYGMLLPGDLIYTGTPAGVSAVQPGDHVEGSIQGLGILSVRIGEPE